MGHTRFLCILLLALSLASVSGRPEDTLEKIEDLVDKDFGRRFPRHGRNLLYWFCREYIKFDNNGKMQPTKDPEDGEFGFHYYGNREYLLPSLHNQRWYDYYVVGNLNEENFPWGERLPNYVLEEFRRSMNLNSQDENNRDRIIVRITPDGAIDRVYITQHYDINSNRGSQYDPDNTYRISTDLIRAIRNIPREWFFLRLSQRTRVPYAVCGRSGDNEPDL
ncbi:uncharacterized protein LOC118234322 isoform X2 [Anguilla anguilla]|nr:uncharacterized protein LOC118234322 isoform X2 [Anguilla anguilla]XP_035286666.1 uncharacterized protein LOC118234322 isoform X2 [Anguilla anguilla]XP_035286667.1 uncharacterized protein LOC118234322 isoform X2 [Anguilla anguilla]